MRGQKQIHSVTFPCLNFEFLCFSGEIAAKQWVMYLHVCSSLPLFSNWQYIICCIWLHYDVIWIEKTVGSGSVFMGWLDLFMHFISNKINKNWVYLHWQNRIVNSRSADEFIKKKCIKCDNLLWSILKLYLTCSESFYDAVLYFGDYNCQFDFTEWFHLLDTSFW